MFLDLGICSEFNFDCDVNAAKYVLENLNCDSTRIVGWETCDQQVSQFSTIIRKAEEM